MRDDDIIMSDMPSGCFSALMGMILAILTCLLITLLMSGCKGKEYVTERVEVPVVVTQEHTIESVKIDHVRDTLIQRDSIYHYVQGDTTIIERWHYLQGTTNIARVDTLHIYDSIPYPVTTTKDVVRVEQVNHLHWWQKALIAIGGVALIAVALFVAFKVGKRKLL
jgi:hypothetical protein